MKKDIFPTVHIFEVQLTTWNIRATVALTFMVRNKQIPVTQVGPMASQEIIYPSPTSLET